MMKTFTHPTYGKIPARQTMPICAPVARCAYVIAMDLIGFNADLLERTSGRMGLYALVRGAMGRTPEIYPDNAYDDESISAGIVAAINTYRGTPDPRASFQMTTSEDGA